MPTVYLTSLQKEILVEATQSVYMEERDNPCSRQGLAWIYVADMGAEEEAKPGNKMEKEKHACHTASSRNLNHPKPNTNTKVLKCGSKMNSRIQLTNP